VGRATLKDGRVVGGFFGPTSFAGYTAETPDLYLEKRYQLNEKAWFDEPAPGTLGIYIRADEIVSVEFYEAGGPPPRLSWWRRTWRRIQHDDPDAHPQPLDRGAAAADPQERRDLPSGPAPAAPDASSSGPDGRREVGPARNS
jgi:hypothetical protein